MNTKWVRVRHTPAIRLLGGIAICTSSSATAQNQSGNMPTSSDYVCVQRSPHARVWQWAESLTNESGVVTTNLHSYTELATSLCYLQNGQYVDSVEEIDAVAGGAQATQGRYQVQWAANANTVGAVNLTTPDNKQMLSTIFGLAYYDSSSGSTVMLGQLKDCAATISSNTLTYLNAFSNLTADVVYTYRKAGLIQDIVLRQQPPPPGDYGFNPAKTFLQVITEFFNPPAPVITTGTNNGVTDFSTLDFGDMKMGVGQAFLFQNDAGTVGGGPVLKSWTNIDNAAFLIEQVPYTSISNLLGSLQSSVIKPDKGKVRRTVWLDPPKPRKVSATQPAQPIKVSKTMPRETGLVLDYELLSSDTNNYTFQGDTTYLVSDLCNLSATNILEGGAVIKYTNTTAAEIELTNLVCETAEYRPAVFTSMDDDSVGDPIPTSTGNPWGDNAGLMALYFPNQSATLQNVRFSHLAAGVSFQNTSSATGGNLTLSNFQFVDCRQVIMSDEATCDLFNGLVYSVSNLFGHYGTYDSDGGQNLTAVNLTVHNCGNYASDQTSAMLFTNCLFAVVTNAYSISNFPSTNSIDLTNDTGVFQTAGAGAHYLATNSPYTNEGTTEVTPPQLADLQMKTVYPPIIYSNVAVTSNLTLVAQAQPDNNGSSLALGYHYDLLDYALNISVSNASITVSNGAVLAMMGPNYGVYLDLSANFNSTGTATRPNYMVRYNTVQEQANTNWETVHWQFLFDTIYSSAGFSFTDWSVLAGDGEYGGGFPPIDFQNCQFYNGSFYGLNQSVSSTNCLFQRVNMFLEAGPTKGPDTDISNTFCNNLFWEGELYFSHFSHDTGIWTLRDNLFDQTAITVANSSTSDISSNNAYVTTNFGVLLPTNNMVILTNSPAYEGGTLGDYYYPTNLTNLIHAGSRLASAAALYHYTVTTDNAVEGTNTVSIGFHYVATDGNGVPLDSNGDGIPDYLEDANGDGIVDDGETNWALAILTQPVSQTACQGSTTTLTVGADGVTPFTYQWQFDGANIGGATNSTYTITNFQTTNGGDYVIVVTNFSGSITSTTAILVSSITNTSYITNGLVAYWKLNDGTGHSSAADSSTNSIALPLDGPPAWVTNGCGAIYVTLNGSSQYGDVGGSSFTNQSNVDTNDLTICAWVNKTGVSQKGIVNKYDPSGTYRGWSFQFNSDNILDFFVGTNWNLADTGPLAVPLGQWAFVTVTWANANTISNTVTYYINGILNSSLGTSGAIETTSGGADLQVGNVFTGTTYAFDGSMHDVAIYNRVLSPLEVASNFLSSEFNPSVPYPDLLYYKMLTEYAQTNIPVLLSNSATDGGSIGTVTLDPAALPEWTNNPGGISNALHFNGASTKCDTSNSNNFNFTTNSFTINLWLLPLTTNGFVMGNNSDGASGWFMSVYTSQLEFGADTTGGESFISTPGPVSGWPNGHWNMVTITRMGANVPLLYINGKIMATEGSFINPDPSTNSLIFGTGTGGNVTQTLDGHIWQPQIWSTALSSTNIANLYDNQMSGIPWP